MSFPTCQPHETLRHRWQAIGWLCPVLLALSAGCAQLRCATEPPMNCSISCGPQGRAEPPKATPAPAVESPGKLEAPITELPPAGKLGFETNDPKQGAPTPQTSPVEPKADSPVHPEALPDKLPDPKSPPVTGQPATQVQAPPAAAPESIERVVFSVGDRNKMVSLSLGSLLEQVERCRPTPEVIIEASAAYVDLLTARAELAVAMQTAERLNDLLQHANAMVNERAPLAIQEVPRIQVELESQQVVMRKCREAALAAATKLRIGLGLDPSFGFGITDQQLVAYPLVDADAAAEELIAQAQRNNPAIEYTQTQPCCCQACDAHQPKRLSLISLLAQRPYQCMAENSPGQTQAAYQDPRAKLSADVQATRLAVLNSRDQMESDLSELSAAAVAYEQTRNCLTQAHTVKDRSTSKVLASICTLEAVHLSYVAAISDFNKAQLRLAVLTGELGGSRHP
jgi:hypothetical protein